MLASRQSDAVQPNPSLIETKALTDEDNLQWLARVRQSTPNATDGVILLGGASPSHFRLRVAQSHVRSDLLPSYWSLSGIAVNDEVFLSVPLDNSSDVANVPPNNGIQECRFSDYRDQNEFPNIAVLRFADNPQFVFNGPNETPQRRSIVENIRGQRGIIDLPALIVAWLSYIWAVGESGNPLLKGLGLPAAVFVETAYGIGGIEMTPGLSSASTCGEAIWHGAKWWQNFYEETSKLAEHSQAKAIIPTGFYTVRQPVAAATWRPKKNG